MDFSSLKDQVSNLSLYDLKAGVRKVQNAVMNYTEMESKVREATNNEPWGASSTLMQEIANGTYNYQLLNEIMPMIYKRFTEKAAEEWRQIYKALQLLEFLIKNGSERVIDDARSHLSLLKMLRQFHFIDQNGKDQGLNVRNRSKELAELLSDVDRIRAERKKARATRNKYGGVEGGMGLGGSMSGSSSRYGGFSSEDAAGYGAYSGGVYGDGGGFGGNTSGFSDTQSRRDRFDEYDEYDEGATAAPASAPSRRVADTSSGRAGVRKETKKPDPPKPKEPEVDLFDFGDEPAAPTPSASNGKAPAGAMDDFGALQGHTADDDFDDFQSAEPAAQPAAAPTHSQTSSFSIPPPASTTHTTTSATQFAQPQPRSGAQGANINDLFSTISPTPSTTSTATTGMRHTPSTSMSAFSPPSMQAPSGYQPNQPNYFTSVPLGNTGAGTTTGASTPSVMSPTGSIGRGSIGGAAKKPAGGDAFSGLLAGASMSKRTSAPTQKVTMADMAKQKSSAGIWGTAGSASPAPAAPQGGAQKSSNGLDDLLG